MPLCDLQDGLECGNVSLEDLFQTVFTSEKFHIQPSSLVYRFNVVFYIGQRFAVILSALNNIWSDLQVKYRLHSKLHYKFSILGFLCFKDFNNLN